MKRSQSNKVTLEKKNQVSETKLQEEYVDLFKLSLERAFGRAVSDEEAEEMDDILSGRSSEDSFE